jgi:hypothetical protein
MNIITAILVNGALEQTDSDKEARRVMVEKSKRRLLKSLRAMFLRLDDDSSGYIDKEEILNMSGQDREMLNDFMNAVADPFDIFDMLDINGVGSLDVDEFCEGLYQAATSNVPLELRRIDKRVDGLITFVHKFADSVELRLQGIEDGVSKSKHSQGSGSPRSHLEGLIPTAASRTRSISSDVLDKNGYNGNGFHHGDYGDDFIRHMKEDLEASIRRHRDVIALRMDSEMKLDAPSTLKALSSQRLPVQLVTPESDEAPAPPAAREPSWTWSAHPNEGLNTVPQASADTMHASTFRGPTQEGTCWLPLKTSPRMISPDEDDATPATPVTPYQR